MDEWKTKMWGIHKIVFSLEKEENLANYDNMDGPWKYYAKWNKPDRKRQIQHGITYMMNLLKKKSQTHCNTE